jgi:PAS domain-containing protein
MPHASLTQETQSDDALLEVEADKLDRAACAGSTSMRGDQRGIIIINAQSIVQLVNEAVSRILGYSQADLRGKSLRTILPPTVADMHFSFVRNYIQTGE